MPAKEDTYRSQRVLHIVFAVSSVAMLVSITWMVIADHFREWKRVQRDFIEFDASKTRKDSEEAKVREKQRDLAELEAELSAAREAIAAEVAGARDAKAEEIGKFQKKDQALAFKKAERDSVASFYDIELDKGNEQKANEIKDQLNQIDSELKTLREEHEDLNDKIIAAEKRIAKAQEEDSKVAELEKEIADQQKEIERVQQKQWSIWSAIRSSPVLDAFAPALKIEQMVFIDLPIHYSFKGVPRFDRCTTCHKGIDSVTKEGGKAFDTDAVEAHSTSPHRAAFKTHSHPELFAGPNSPHPREKFGCTICHLGQGSGTSFVFASHTPNTVKQREEWMSDKTKDYGWNEIHHWPWQMSKSRFVESGCVKCHPHVVELESSKYGETAPKLLKGYNIVRQYGCFGCHEITGWKPGTGRLIGPDLRLEPQTEGERKKASADPLNPPGRLRKVGPSLRHLAEKVQPDWAYRWINLPKGFRPGTRMPQFYGLTNNNGKLAGSDTADVAKSSVELHAIVHYLYSNSVPSANPETPDTVKVDPANSEQTKRGQDRFIERGCLACHSHKDVSTKNYPQANANFGPDLSNVAAKLKNKDGTPNTKWLFNWLKDPLVYHSTSFMPNLQIKDDEAADIAAWLLSVQGSWAEDPGQPKLDEKVLDDLITMFLQKSMTLRLTKEVLSSGLTEKDLADVRGDERMLAAPMTPEKKLTYLGKKTISRMGCFGCHDIPGFETAKPIGTELSAWGLKARMDPEKLDFAHIVEYLEHHSTDQEKHNPDFELFLEGMMHHKGESFLWQKLRDPRSYDFNKLKAWDDKLRMPRFPFADNPEDVEAVMTFILGLVADDQIPQHYRNIPQSGAKLALIEGEKALTKFNCRGCHMTKMPEFKFDLAKTKFPEPGALHGADFPDTAQDQNTLTRKVSEKSTGQMAVQAMLIQTLPSELERAGEIPSDAEELIVDLWEPMRIENKQYFIGDRLTLPVEALDKQQKPAAQGGQFAELLVSHLMKKDRKQVGEVWAFVPPPLVREGMKAQPAWLHQFLLNPSEIRPAVRLRMPRFNMTSDEASQLAGYFAAVDNMEYPYEHIQQRDDSYLAQKESQHANYLTDGWSLLTFEPKGDVPASQKLCANCHRVGNKAPEGGTPDDKGPNLVLTPDRLRPDWLRQWIATPRRVLPYTGMPNNFSAAKDDYQSYFRGTSAEQVLGVRDALMNYHRVQQSELVKKPSTPPATGGN